MSFGFNFNLFKRFLRLGFAGLASCLISLTARATPPAGYYLVWGDEFNGTSLDTTKWDFWELGTWGNAINVTNAVTVNGSNLVITTYTSGGNNYTAMLASDQHFQPRYGYYEASIKWGDTNGMWSAFWLRSPTMGNWLNDAYVSGAEFDACEHRYVGIYETNYIANIVSDNIHWDGYGAAEKSAGSPNVGNNLQTGFHTYGFLWNQGTYNFSIDGSEVWNGTPAPLFGSGAYILLSSQVNDTQTTWAGYIPSGGYGSQAASTVKMTVDYFRYYAPTNVLFWTGSNSGSWNNSANWVSNMIPGPGTDLTFSYLSANLNCTLGANYSVDGLVFLATTNSAPVIGGANTLTLGAGGIDMVAGTQNVTLNAPIAIASSQTWRMGINNPGNRLTVNSSLSGSGALTKAGWGTLVLTGSNSFSGQLNVDTGASATNDGILVIGNAASVANVASPIQIRNTGMAVSTLQLSNGVSIPQTINLAGRNTNVLAIEALSGNVTLGGGLTLTGGGSNYLIQCDSGTLNINGTIAGGPTASGPCGLTLQGNANFTLSGPIQDGASSALSLLKTNNGTLRLSGANSFSGGLTNAGGTLYLNGSIGGPVVFNSGTLAGTGSIAGNMALNGGEISPGAAIGNSIGTLAFGSNVTLGSRTVALMTVNAATGTNGQLDVAGSITFSGTLYVVNMAGNFTPDQSFQLFKAGACLGSFDTLTLPSLTNGLSWDTNGLTKGILSVIPTQPLAIANLGRNQIQLNWSYGSLQSATNVQGPYTNVPGAVPPLVVSTSVPRQYYRISP